MKNKQVKMTFEVIIPFKMMTNEEDLKKDFKGDIHRVAKYLYREEGIWWDEKMVLVKTEFISK